MPTFAQNCLVDSLAALVNLKCLNPNSQNTFQLADIVSLMDNELSLAIVPLLKKTGQEYFVYNVDVPIVQGQSSYVFPPRAIGNAVRDVVLLDAGGNELALNQLMREYIKVAFPYNMVPALWSFSQYLSANEVNLYNPLIQSYTAYKLRFITERRPNGLTLSTNCGQITAINGNVVSLSYLDPTWTTSQLFDIINPNPPFQSIQDDQSITAISGFTITFSSIPTLLAVGQWFCPAGLSPIPQIPYEIFPLLIERGVATVAEALDMAQLLASSKAKIQSFEDNAAAIVRPRVKGSLRRIINQDMAASTFPFSGGIF